MSDSDKSKSEPSKMLQPLDVSNLLEEEAEEHLLRVFEKGRARAAPSDKVWDASVEGERPPLRRVTKEGAHVFSSGTKRTKWACRTKGISKAGQAFLCHEVTREIGC